MVTRGERQGALVQDEGWRPAGHRPDGREADPMAEEVLVRQMRVLLLVAAVSWWAVPPALAQNWSFDARRVALGGVGSERNIASRMIEDERDYRAVVLPLGLLQVLRNRDVFDPTSDRFDLVRSIEYAASPLHYQVSRDGTGTGSRFVTDVRNGRLSTDLNDYRGFLPANQPVAQGLAAPSYGVTIPVARGDYSRHGVFVGAGPYLSMRGALSVDQQLIDIWSSPVPMYVPDADLELGTALRGQVGMALTGGYRARIAAFGIGPRDGLYVAANYHHLRGFRYEDADFALRVQTDQDGMVTWDAGAPLPLLVTRDMSGSGRGFAMDLGAGAVVGRWEVGFGANGVANRIDWRNVTRVTYALEDLLLHQDFVESAPVALGDRQVRLPVEYLGNAGYHADRWSALAEVGRGLQGTSVHGGLEYRLGPIEPRVGLYYARERWQPSGGVGLQIAPRIGVDVAAYSTDANVQRTRHAAFAASLRIGR
jgi:hypothetical protein